MRNGFSAGCRARRRLAGGGAATAAVAAGVLIGAAPAAAMPALSAHISPHVVTYTHPARIHGAISTRHPGVRVALWANAFPFGSGFGRVATRTSGHHGAYSFARQPSTATRYRVARSGQPSAHSPTRTAYVEPQLLSVRCNLCDRRRRLPGRHKLRLSYSLRYPRAVYGVEAAKRVFFYYGQRNGSRRHPRRLQLVDTVRQRRRPPSQTRVVITHTVRFPAVFAWRFAACTRTSERSDGFGVPGAPGSRGCGNSHISYRQSLRWLG